MALITLKEWAERHGRQLATCRQKAGRGGFQTAQRIGRDWFIDEDEPASDLRIRSGKYVGFRDNLKHNEPTEQ